VVTLGEHVSCATRPGRRHATKGYWLRKRRAGVNGGRRWAGEVRLEEGEKAVGHQCCAGFLGKKEKNR
jgi:hypothetical protein